MTPRQYFSAVNSGPWVTSGQDVQYRIEVSAQAITLFFQPTESLSDWVHNFDFPAVPYKDMTVIWRAHRGFVELWKSVRDEVAKKILDSYQSYPLPLVVVGYSEGAAIALLAYEDLRFRLPKALIQGIGFGTPRVLWGPSPDARFDSFVRYSVRGDIVTMVPPWLFGFHHVGKSIKVGPVHFPWWVQHTPEQYLDYLPA